MYIFCTTRGKSYHFRANFSPNEVKEVRVYVDNICWNTDFFERVIRACMTEG